jgi:hypothetical protein
MRQEGFLRSSDGADRLLPEQSHAIGGTYLAANRDFTIDARKGAELLLRCGNAGLRAAIVKNAVSFPSQIVRLGSCGNRGDRPEHIEHIIQLYFVHGWSAQRISRRYGLSAKAVEDILTYWRRRAVAAGFVQVIQPWEAEAGSSRSRVCRDHAMGGPSPIGRSGTGDSCEA